MDDRQSVAFDKLMKEQKKKKAALLTITLVAAVLVFLLGLLFGIAISSNALAFSAGAEELVREDPLLSPEEHVVLRSVSNPEYLVNRSGYAAFASWLTDNGYTSSSNLFVASDPIYLVYSGHPEGNAVVSGFYASSSLHVMVGSTDISLVSNYPCFGFDSASLYHFFRFTVGLGYSDFDVHGFDQPIAVAEDTVASIFTVGDKLLSFVTNNVLVLIPLVLFLGVFAFGSIKRLITGV